MTREWKRGDKALITRSGQSVSALVLEVAPNPEKLGEDLATIKIAVFNPLAQQWLTQTLPKPVPTSKLTQRYSKIPDFDFE